MKRTLFILLFYFVFLVGKAQEKNQFALFTDRDLYTSGESLLFKVFVPSNELSGIIHIDLVNAKGKIISGVARKIVGHEADGFVELPDSLSTGTYLLCTSLKNSSLAAIKELFICNRFTGIAELNNTLRLKQTGQFIHNQTNKFSIVGLDKAYKTRGRINPEIHLPAELVAQINGKLLVSVAETTPGFNSTTVFRQTKSSISQKSENDGVVLEGIVKDFKTGEPFKNGIVYLSIPDTFPRFKYFITRSNGRFSFQLDNYFGKIPVVVQCLDQQDKQLLKLVLDRQDSLYIESLDFELTPVAEELRQASEQSIEVVNFSKLFNQQELAIAPSTMKKTDSYPFYGIPNQVIDPQKFIELPDFSEIAREIIPGVKFISNNRIPTMQVFNPAQFGFFKNPPLVLLDGIPVHDLNVIRNLGSNEIDRIEICNTERYFGYLRFPGVVAIYSLKPDFARLMPSDNLVKLNLDALQPDVSLNIPDGQKLNEMDLRKVLMWKPAVEPEQTIKLGFTTSDVKGNYKLIVQGMNKDGSLFYKEQIFEVN